MELQGKVAIITGAGRGIGARIALTLAAEGAKVVVNDIDEGHARKIVSEIEGIGQTAVLCSDDVSHSASANALVEFTKKEFGSLDIVVNNAGITRDSMLHKMTDEQWDQVIAVNLRGVFNVTRAAAIEMKQANRGGAIVNLSSIARSGNIGQTNYSASKAGVVGMTKTLALELGRSQVRVNAVAPGFIETEMTAAVPEKVKQHFIDKTPLGRMGRPKEIADLVLFLVSERSSFITGQCIGVDGGLSVGMGGL